jgi:hypothetical protein
MLGRTNRIDAVKENVASSAELAARLAQDKKLRKQLISAVAHGAAARREVKSRTNLVPVVARLASEPQLRGELQSALDELRKAWGRVQRQKPSHTGRNAVLALLAVAGAAAAARAFFARGDDRPS